MAERLKAPVLKIGSGVSRSWVRIPPLPPAAQRLRQSFVSLQSFRSRSCPAGEAKEAKRLEILKSKRRASVTVVTVFTVANPDVKLLASPSNLFCRKLGKTRVCGLRQNRNHIKSMPKGAPVFDVTRFGTACFRTEKPYY